MSWGDVEISLARKVASQAQTLKDQGRLSDASYVQALTDANRLAIRGQAKNERSKSAVFKKGITSVGKVAVGTVAGLLTGGPVGGVAGFVGSAASMQTGGVSPSSLVDVSTPPIVNPKQEPKPKTADFGDVYVEGDAGPFLILAGWAVMLWIVFKKVLK